MRACTTWYRPGGTGGCGQGCRGVETSYLVCIADCFRATRPPLPCRMVPHRIAPRRSGAISAGAARSAEAAVFRLWAVHDVKRSGIWGRASCSGMRGSFAGGSGGGTAAKVAHATCTQVRFRQFFGRPKDGGLARKLLERETWPSPESSFPEPPIC